MYALTRTSSKAHLLQRDNQLVKDYYGQLCENHLGA